jgi:hypothetical protein
MVSVSVEAIDGVIAAALRGEPVDLPSNEQAALLVERVHYHGVAGLLGQEAALAGWPEDAARAIRQEAFAATIWELRHRQLLALLLDAFAAAAIPARLLKGTALAYSLFAVPAARSRGDSDLLIRPADLARARAILGQQGFQCDESGDDGFALQEPWSYCGKEAVAHHVDLHWQVLNTPALAGVLRTEECFDDPVALPDLSPNAFAMSRPLMLVHACVHRSMHFTSPYFVDGRQYFGGDRLIWLYDIHLLGEAMPSSEWARFTALASERGVAGVCLDGLLTAQRFLSSKLPEDEIAKLRRSPSASLAYLSSRQFGRAWEDLKAMPGMRAKLGFARSRTFPSASFIRDKYPQLARLPLALLYARRMIDLVRPRPRPDR